MATCPHGFAPGQCLICRTLEQSPSPAAGPRRGRAERRAAHREAVPGGPVEVVGGRPRTPARRATTHILVAIVVIAVAVAAFWVVAGLVSALLHLAEILVAAGIAGVLGYRLGRARGHRDS
jgi:hypothetical protein